MSRVRGTLGVEDAKPLSGTGSSSRIRTHELCRIELYKGPQTTEDLIQKKSIRVRKKLLYTVYSTTTCRGRTTPHLITFCCRYLSMLHCGVEELPAILGLLSIYFGQHCKASDQWVMCMLLIISYIAITSQSTMDIVRRLSWYRSSLEVY